MAASTAGRRAPRAKTPPKAKAKARPTSRRAPAGPPGPRRTGHASKVSITVDSGVLDEVRKLLRATGQSLSAHVTEAIERDLRRRRLQQILDEYEAEAGVIGEEELTLVRRSWQG